MKTIIKIEELAPTFILPATFGGLVDVGYFKQRKNLVLVFLHNHECKFCQRVARAFRFFASRYKEENAEVFLIFPEKPKELQSLVENIKLPYKVLADEGGTTLAKFMELYTEEEEPLIAVFVIDRFGALLDQWFSPREEVFPDQERFLDALNQAEIACPECGIHEWPL